eukprot:267952_1
MNYTNTVPPSYTGSEEDKNTRFVWKIESKLEYIRHVLYAMANHDIHLGYTQGMGYIAALLLMLMTEDEAFWCLCSILDNNNTPDFSMRELYVDGLPLLNLRYFQFDQLVKNFT